MNARVPLWLTMALVLLAGGATFFYFATQQAEIAYSRAEDLSERGDFEKAAPLYKKTVEANPDKWEAHALLGEILTWQKKYDEAIGHLEKALALKDDLKVKQNLGRVYLYTRRHEKAEAIFKEILTDHPQDEETLLLLAKTLHYSGRSDEAAGIAENLLKAKE